ncbi:MAG: succinyl-diaminopimelate desuccinylase [Deltaproteobacteria bacterium ADurb.Bin207]|nr:MAG: succinyl-diaminopimelate desuccinylase [Deltaproteobacteria bacterium ADurb.Bin207]
MKGRLAEKITDLTLELTSVRSIVGTAGEVDIANRVHQIFRKMKYFQQHPENLHFVPVPHDPLGRKSVLAIVKGEKRQNKKAIVLIGHIDTVGTSDYGLLEPYATKPLELAEKFKEASLTDEVRTDLESGNYLFGRGIFDMKCGVSTLMAIIESVTEDIQGFEGNLVFAAVCDEEGNSSGMLSVVPELIRLQAQEGFEYQALLDTDYSAPRFAGDTTKYVYIGTVGKLMPSFYVVGSEAHGGDPFKGLDSNHLSSAIMQEIDFNMKYSDEAEGEVTVPPISLKQTDLKQEYSVQTPKTGYLYFNYGTHASGPHQVLDKVMAGAKLAFQNLVDRLNEEHETYCKASGIPFHKLPWTARVLSYAELYDRVVAEKGVAAKEVLETRKNELLADPNVDERLFALRMVETLHNLWSDNDPVVIAYFSPPYYPHVFVKGDSPLEKKLLRVVDELIQQTYASHHVKMKRFYPYISDLSYASAPRDPSAIEALQANMPGFGTKYVLPLKEMQDLNLPVINIGPFGKDAHRYTERLEKQYSFDIVPGLVRETIIKLLQ